MTEKAKTQLFKVLELADPPKAGSDLKLYGWFVGEMEAKGNRLFYKDAAGQEWIFYPGDTCQLGTNQEKEQDELLGNWDRFNKSLLPGQRVEITPEIYHNLLACLPPTVWNRETSYFEVGEPHHHEGGQAIHRACWVEFGKFYTGYPTMANRYELPGFKRNPLLYEPAETEQPFVKYLVTFIDKSTRIYICSAKERNIFRAAKNWGYVHMVRGDGFVKLARSGKEGSV